MRLFRRSSEFEDRADLERMLQHEFSRQGVHGIVVRDPDDPLNSSLHDGERAWGFANIMIRALPEPRRRWRAIVREHVTRILRPTPETDLDADAGRAMLRARVVPDGIRGQIAVGYALPFAPGLLEVMCLDHPDSVQTLNDSALAGHDVPRLRDIARRNLELEEVPPASRLDDDLSVVEGESMFVASQLLRPDFVDDLRGSAPGVAVAMPDRHLLLFQPVTGASSSAGIGRLARLASEIDRDARPGGFISPHVYYVSDAGVQQITEQTPDGGMRIVADGAFLEAIDREP